MHALPVAHTGCQCALYSDVQEILHKISLEHTKHSPLLGEVEPCGMYCYCNCFILLLPRWMCSTFLDALLCTSRHREHTIDTKPLEAVVLAE